MSSFVSHFTGLYCKEKKNIQQLLLLDISYTYLQMDYKYNSG